MKIVVDINHPAHVHYFKKFIWEMQKRGHRFLITTSDKDIACKLLDLYQLPYTNLGSYGKGIIRKILNVPVMDLRMYNAVKRFEPDLFVSFGSIRAAHVSKMLLRPHIALEDTEHSVLSNWLYRPFTNIILTPACFQKDFGKKQIRFAGTTDLLYLHPNRFTPDPKVLEELGLTEKDTFFIVRFISWDANHDIGQTGIADREGFVHEMTKYGRVFITSENELPESLKKYQITISPEKIHDLMYYATLFVGESGTMATEAACMGVHAVVVNPEARQGNGRYTFGVFQFYHEYELLWAYNTEREALQQVGWMLDNGEKLKELGKEKRAQLLCETEDLTAFLVRSVNECIADRK